jgi:hypothetical protein
MCKGNDVVVSRLAAEGCRGVWWGWCGVDSNCVGEVTGREEGAFEDVVVRSACYLDPAQCQRTDITT